MPKAIISSGISIKLPPNMAAAGWDIDADILQDFCKEFGIKWDIDFRFTSGNYTWGTHCCKEINGNWRHSITLSQTRSIEDARNTILHELCHAIQNERDGDPWNYESEYRRYNSTGRHYQKQNPFEIEAVQFAADNLERWSDILY